MCIMKSSKYKLPRSIFLLFILLILSSIKHSKCEIDTSMDLVLLTEDGEEYKTNATKCPFGSYFYREARHIHCICSKGIWIFYESACGLPNFIQGSENLMCTTIDFEIQKSLLISDRIEPSITAVHPKNGISIKIFQNSISLPFSLVEDELIISSGQWTFLFNNGKTACVGKLDRFCLYTAEQFNRDEIDSVFMGCHEFKNHANIPFEPKQCHEFLMGNKTGASKCVSERREKRSSSVDAAGRAYIPTMLAMNPEYVANLVNLSSNGSMPVFDEDEQNVTRGGNPIIKSQIWNYLTEKATEILQLYDTEPTAKNIRVPAFKFLEVAKEIMQNRCPEHYVPKSHFDMSVSAFRAIQLREILYDEVPVTHEEVERIMKILNDCKNNTNEQFPFIHVKMTCNDSNPVAPGVIVTENPFETMGQFSAFDQEMFLDVPFTFSPDAREPIIDTVWNIYLHAHSACFPYFNRSSYNDHHKFSTIMLSLFTNGILDLWTEVKELEPDIYSGFLGNAVELMYKVVHCAVSARLDGEVTYPWDLLRPNATEPGVVRKKRSVPNYALPQDLQAQLGCIGNIHENAFVCKE